MFSRYKNNCCPYKSLLHAKPSASVNTAVHIGVVYATDKLRRVELYYREEVSNKQLYICILSDVSCKYTDNRKSVKHFSSFESIRPSLLLVGSVSTFVFRYLRTDCSGFFFNDRMRKQTMQLTFRFYSNKEYFQQYTICSSR